MTPPTSPVLILDAIDTTAAVDPLEVLAAVREALVEISRGTVSAPPRIAARAPDGLLGCMPAYVPGVGLAAKLVSVFEVAGGRSTHLGLVAVFDKEDGRPLAIMEAGRLTAVRTAAAATASMQALDLMRDGSPHRRRGAGTRPAGAARRAAHVVRRRGRRPRPGGGRHIASVFADVATDPIREAVRDAGYLCCTGATTPVIQRDWLAPGAHVSSVGGSHGHEVDAATVADADLYVEWLGAAAQAPPAGAHELQGVSVDRLHLLGSSLEAGGPPPAERLTLFKLDWARRPRRRGGCRRSPPRPRARSRSKPSSSEPGRARRAAGSGPARAAARGTARWRCPSALATSAGVPVATTRPPASPPPGPRSMTQSAVAIASRSCSTRTTVLPASTSRCSWRSSSAMSAGCSPEVGSSSR